MRRLPLPDDRTRPRRRRGAGPSPGGGRRAALPGHRLPRADRPRHCRARWGAPRGDLGGQCPGVRCLRRRSRRCARRDRGRPLRRARRSSPRSRRSRRARPGDRPLAGMTYLAIENIGLLVTNDEGLGEGPLGIVRDATLVLEGDRVAAVERAAAAADESFDAAGRCVIPGFVDSHTHLVFAGDRAEEFAARMAGRPYEASGIRVTTEATRAAGDDQLRALATARRAEALRAGITHLEIKSGYGLDVAGERRPW